MIIQHYVHYPHGMEKQNDGDYILVNDLEDILNEFLGTLDRNIIVNLFNELRKK